MTASEQPFEVRDSIVNDYLYSYGGISRFFREIVENRQIMGTRCPTCAKVWCPPRTHCSDCYVATTWIPLSGEGVVRSAINCYYVPTNYSLHKYLHMPYVLALVQLDGADTCLHSVVHVDEPVLGSVKPGMRVRAVFREQREGRLTDFYFAPIGS